MKPNLILVLGTPEEYEQWADEKEASIKDARSDLERVYLKDVAAQYRTTAARIRNERVEGRVHDGTFV